MERRVRTRTTARLKSFLKAVKDAGFDRAEVCIEPDDTIRVVGEVSAAAPNDSQRSHFSAWKEAKNARKA